ncbi:MAG: cysteine synthase A [Peptococcaceae bacterium]|nr:cysteine synthase A [Peptococcaceae bacterium]
MNIYSNVTELVGHTPIVELQKIAKAEGIKARIFAKLENYNPTGSMKDRVALAMIRDAEASGKLTAGGTIIEPTSGNTGIGLAAIGAYLGYKVIIVMPDSMSVERRKLMQIYGAELVLTPGAQGMSGAIAKANEFVAEMDNAIVAGQFDNPANPKAHYDVTGPEIWAQMDGKVDALVAGVGTGGSLSGNGRYLKDQRADIQVIAVEPKASAVLSGGQAGPHALQGIGAGFVPGALDTEVYDEVMPIANEDALAMVGRLAREEGLFMGISSAAALLGALQWSKRDENEGKNVVVLLPDTGMRYLSTGGIFE